MDQPDLWSAQQMHVSGWPSVKNSFCKKEWVSWSQFYQPIYANVQRRQHNMYGSKEAIVFQQHFC
jgi:hypothetical protein